MWKLAVSLSMIQGQRPTYIYMYVFFLFFFLKQRLKYTIVVMASRPSLLE